MLFHHCFSTLLMNMPLEKCRKTRWDFKLNGTHQLLASGKYHTYYKDEHSVKESHILACMLLILMRYKTSLFCNLWQTTQYRMKNEVICKDSRASATGYMQLVTKRLNIFNLTTHVVRHNVWILNAYANLIHNYYNSSISTSLTSVIGT
jgi:hypothetical protein